MGDEMMMVFDDIIIRCLFSDDEGDGGASDPHRARNWRRPFPRTLFSVHHLSKYLVG